MRKSVGALIALITFLAFFVAMMPAAFVYNFFQDKISRVIPDVKFNGFKAPSGLVRVTSRSGISLSS